ncbi:MAG: glycosyltransferase [Verrucomicrobiota bacterium]|nr:glycosyltransferase [Verrucomicrobiota bacterium]
MKILQMVQTLDARSGGVARAVVLLSEEIARHGHEVEITTLDLDASASAGATTLPVHALGRGPQGYGYSPRLAPWLKRHGRNYDCVIVNGCWQYSGLVAWRRFRNSPVPYYVFPHGMLDPWFKRTYPLKHLKKWIYWPWAEYRVLRDARGVIFTSDAERLQARGSFWLYHARERVAPLGVEVPLVASRDDFFARFPQLEGKRLVLFLGRLHVKKGPDILIDAFSRAAPNDPSVVLVIAGPDQEGFEKKLRARAERSGLQERIAFAGMLEGAVKWGALRAAEVFALPSHQENFALAVVEALACGTPVLISDKINIWREVQNDSAGLVESDDRAGTERLLRRWFAMDESERTAMRRAAANCFSKRFEIGGAAALLLKILAET